MAKNSVAVDPGCLPPPVTVKRGLSGVTRLAQRPQVRLVVGAAVFKRENVVGLMYWRIVSDLEAVLTQRMLCDVGGADLALTRAVATVNLRIPSC